MLRKSLIIIIVFSCLFGLGSNSLAESNESPKIVPLSESLAQIDQIWQVTFQAAQEGNDSLVSSNVKKLDLLRERIGVRAFEDFSIELVAQGLTRYSNGDKQAAALYLNFADTLSQNSPIVDFKSLRLAQVTIGLSEVFKRIGRGLSDIWSPGLLLVLGGAAIYPILWALTFSLYFAFVLLFLYSLADILRMVAQYLPRRFKGFLAPLITLLILLLPCLFGPVPSILVWSLMTLVFIPNKKWMAFCVAGTVILWGIFIPIRENLRVWLQDSGAQTVLSLANDNYGRSDLIELKRFLAGNPSSGTAWYYYGQLLKWNGLLKEAQAAFLKAEDSFGQLPWTLAERGSISFLLDGNKEADKLMTSAQELGMNSAAFLFNFSKVKFALAEIMKREDYIGSVEKDESGKFPVMKIQLKYHGVRPAIQSIKRESKPGHRQYRKSDELPRVLNGYGVAILSTSQGLMTEKEAREHGVGGEFICSIY